MFFRWIFNWISDNHGLKLYMSLQKYRPLPKAVAGTKSFKSSPNHGIIGQSGYSSLQYPNQTKNYHIRYFVLCRPRNRTKDTSGPLGHQAYKHMCFSKCVILPRSYIIRFLLHTKRTTILVTNCV